MFYLLPAAGTGKNRYRKPWHMWLVSGTSRLVPETGTRNRSVWLKWLQNQCWI